jgi:CBS-domain-containing membrane protein
MTRVGNLMTLTCVTVPPTMPMLEARHLMLEKNIRHLPVTDGSKLIGIIRDRDIRLGLPSAATSFFVWEISTAVFLSGSSPRRISSERSCIWSEGTMVRAERAHRRDRGRAASARCSPAPGPDRSERPARGVSPGCR